MKRFTSVIVLSALAVNAMDDDDYISDPYDTRQEPVNFTSVDGN